MSLIVFSTAVLFTSVGAGVVGAILGLGGGILVIRPLANGDHSPPEGE